MEAIKRSWKEQSFYIWTMITEISDICGGDDKEWLKSYSKDLIKDNRDDLGRVIHCFEDLHKKFTYLGKGVLRETPIRDSSSV